MNVLVIGAGIIGASIAEALTSQGARVTVLDMRSPGRGATQASAGLLAPYTEAREHPALLELCVRSFALYDEFIDRVRERSGLAVTYDRSGTLEVATAEDHAARLAETLTWLAERDVPCEWLTPEQLRQFEPTVNAACGGLLMPTQGFVGASALVRALVQASRLNGASFEAPVEAVRIEPAMSHVDVRADAQVFTADAVVLAGGSWSGRVRMVGESAVPVRPIRGQLLELKWASGPLPKRPVWGTRAYTVPWQPDTLLVGATVEDVGFNEHSTVSGVHGLLDAVSELLPAAKDARIADIRVGLRPAAPDGMPIIRPSLSDPRVYVATGHYRNGILLAPLTAAIVADQILGGRHEAL